MRRADRLLQIIQILRRERRPISGRTIASELEVSLRTIYRDIAGAGSIRRADFGRAERRVRAAGCYDSATTDCFRRTSWRSSCWDYACRSAGDIEINTTARDVSPRSLPFAGCKAF